MAFNNRGLEDVSFMWNTWHGKPYRKVKHTAPYSPVEFCRTYRISHDPSATLYCAVGRKEHKTLCF